MTIGWRKLFDEVECDRMPWSRRNRELLDETERLVSGSLVSLAGNTTVNIVFDVSTYVRPGVIASEQVVSSVLSRVSSSWMIMFELEDTGVEVTSIRAEVRNVDAVINE